MRSLVVTLVVLAAAAAQAGEVVSVVTTSGRTYLLEVDPDSGSGSTLSGIDAATGERIKIASTEIRQKSPTTDDGALVRLGHLRFIAWKVRSLIGSPQTGKVIDADENYVYSTLSGSKIEQGEDLKVYRIEGELKDPDTGRVLGVKKSPVAKVRVEEVTDTFSKSKRLDDTNIQVGDTVEQDTSRKAVAILPFLDSEGQETPQAKTVSEQLGTGLRNNGITLVERMRFNEVVNELALQTNFVFDPKQVKEIGRQLGATAVIFGTLTTKGTRYEVHAKIVKVETGEIIAAAAYDGGPVPPPTVPTVTTVQEGVEATVKLDPARAKKKPLSYMFVNQKEIERNWGTVEDATKRKFVNNTFRTSENLTSAFTFGGDCDIVFTYATAGKVTFFLFGERFEVEIGDGKGFRQHRVAWQKRGNKLAIMREDGKNQVITLRDEVANSHSNIAMRPWSAYSIPDKGLYPLRLDIRADRIGDPEVITIGNGPLDNKAATPINTAPPAVTPMTNPPADEPIRPGIRRINNAQLDEARQKAMERSRLILEQTSREPEKKP
jgi:TolB-like protein